MVVKNPTSVVPRLHVVVHSEIMRKIILSKLFGSQEGILATKCGSANKGGL